MSTNGEDTQQRGKPSPVEAIKAASDYLRGDMAKELVDGTDRFGKASVALLKPHGFYQQDNRDTRSEIRAAGGLKSNKAISFMLRTKIPGGKLASEQLLAEIDLGDEIGNSTLRITTRQGLQLHGVLKKDLKRTIARINQVQLSTLGACGDNTRNVMCSNAPYNADPVHRQMLEMADALAVQFAPHTRAYHELWLTDSSNGEQVLAGGGEPEVEPIYGATYLPRKFKIAIGLPGDNSVDVYANDLAFLAVCRDWNIVGYNVLVGGGFGMTPSAKKTFPAIAKRMAFVTPDQVLDVATAVVKVYRDFGDRSDRKRARLKYVIADWGLPRFKAKVEEYFGRPLPDPTSDDVWGFDDGLGWHEQGDGLWFYGLNVENGRIKDEGSFRLKSALRKICTELRPGIRLTPHQSILFIDLPSEQKPMLEQILREHGVPLSEEITNLRRYSMACPALPTCGLAVAESERTLPGIIDQLEVEVARLGLSPDIFTLRMTGCPNGCARPYNSDIGLVGKTAGKYTVYLGGRLLGNRLNFIYKDLVPEEEIVSTLVPVLVYYKSERQSGESLGDFCYRKGLADLLAFSERYATTT